LEHELPDKSIITAFVEIALFSTKERNGGEQINFDSIPIGDLVQCLNVPSILSLPDSSRILGWPYCPFLTRQTVGGRSRLNHEGSVGGAGVDGITAVHLAANTWIKHPKGDFLMHA
jgi:hypothetical protein